MNYNTNQLLRELAEKLGTTTEYLWGVLVKQAPIQAMVEVIIMVTLLVVCPIVTYVGNKKVNNSVTGSSEECGWVVLIVLGFCVTLGAFVMLLCRLPGIISGFYNPEYWALQQILKQLH